ncbi:MAG: TonB family protein [Bacteroidaceae bacterium]|nr:TonB family protein [Bacteroidaceae bacterium]
MNYLLLSAVALALFYLFFKLLMSQDTFHSFNRATLLVVLALSAVLPLIHLNLGSTPQTLSYMLQEFTVFSGDAASVSSAAEPAAQADPASVSPRQVTGFVLLIVYLLGVFVFLLRFVVGLVRSLRLGHEGYQKLDDGCRLILHDTDYAPFSWMNRIVVSRKDYAENGALILAHERAHIRLRHSWDLLLVQLCCIAQWFNPAVWLLKKELQSIHEYEADEATLRSGVNARQYQLRLIETALGAKFSSIANNFTNISTKKRILMMMKKQTSPWACLKVLYMLPIAALILVAASCQPANGKNSAAQAVIDKVEASSDIQLTVNDDNVAPIKISRMKTATNLGTGNEPIIVVDGKEMTPEEFESIAPETIESITVLKEKSATEVYGDKGKDGAIIVDLKKNPTVAIEDAPKAVAGSDDDYKPLSGDQVFNVVEEMPEFPGGIEGLMKYLSQNIKYPKEAQDANKEGRVVVSFTVKKDGHCEDFEVVKSVDPSLDAEALRVLKEMPNWKPGKQRGKEVNVKFTIPVSFKLNKEWPKTE